MFAFLYSDEAVTIDGIKVLDVLRFGIGTVIFAWASYHQHQCHRILAQLRGSESANSGYLLPNGDWFEFVSSPHYLAEVIVYLSLLLVVMSDPVWWLVVGFVMGNLTYTALGTHRWYKRKFEHYPKSRTAIFPGVL